MEIIHIHHYCIIILSSLFRIAWTATSSPTAYDVIQTYNLPPGLIPKGLTGYDLDAGSGKFRGYLNGSCGFSVDGGSYRLKFKPTITGYIRKNRLTDLTGIGVKVVSMWLNVVEVVRDGDELEFSIGVATAYFPVGNFEESPECGCGMDCTVSGHNRKIVGTHRQSSSLFSM